ncbi:TonB-dependent receptor [Sphingobacterium psychroaquaticum]|uniref:TonB-dependent receptor domain-containing protein n=1 Tax=Sphingobacterium psychroaquaticum TaxID=561061 RepID=UPI00106A3E5F|nr:TonB-dependent receptor [Sphingobacterium psychroaquaticum]QBQ42395.1 TonB-dependent receptor [Sphingobacterium psychroaquaticum]
MKIKSLFTGILTLVLVTLYSTTFAQKATSITFDVAGNCGMCKQRIEKAAKVKGVSEATWNAETGKITVAFDSKSTNAKAIKQAIADVGHDTDEVRAKDDVYAKLHECCMYDRIGDDDHDDHAGHDHNDHAGHDHAKAGDPKKAEEEDDHHAHDHEHVVRGVVVRENEKGELTPIPGVNVHWLDDPKKQLQSNENGVFDIKHEKGYKQLVVSFVGMKSDTITVKNLHDILVIHAKNNVLEEVVVSRKQKSSYISKMTPNRVEMITAKELFKAACCDLSESFTTNASVDVVSSDAVTGAKQIQLLGLSGVYTQLTVENLPGPRGFAAPLGLNSMAGPWIESIQISKGMGSVANGFESMSGQINVELKKPHNSDRLYFNAYANNMGRTDVNLNLSQKINDKWSVGMLLHDNFMYNKTMNFSNNGFRDMPVGNTFSGINRWHYENGKGLIAQFGIKYLNDDRVGGEIDFNEKTDKLTTNKYGLAFDIERIEGFAKIGYIFPNHKLRSIGLQLSGSHYKQDSYFGLTTYNNEQNSGYANLLFQDVIGSVKHKYKAGVSVAYDKYNESILTNKFDRTETVSGAFVEYTYAPNEKFDAVLGLRQDYNSIYGWFTTPRAVLRYAPTTTTTLRLSSGRGQRTANIFAENMGIFASSRLIDYTKLSNTDGTAYGLKPEVSWNTGLTLDQDFKLFGRESGFSVELFHNNFSNQVVVDYEDPRAVSFYNLAGKSFSNSVQAEFRFMPMQHFEAKLAYRLLDVQTDYEAGRLQKPLTAKHRGFVNLGYNLHSGWSFDYVFNVTGKKRLPSTASNPVEYQRGDYSDAYVTMNAQVSKSFGANKNFTIYVGGENLTNFYQKDPILAFDQPFGEHFDTNLLWGPVAGRLFYTGVRFNIK